MHRKIPGKSLLLSLLVLLLAASIPAGAAAGAAKTQPQISIYLDGNRLVADAPPYIDPKLNVTMVPLRIISANLGAIVEWSQKERKVRIHQRLLTLEMKAGDKTATANGAPVALDAPVTIMGGRVMVPLRFVAKQLGLQVTWYQSARTITLLSPQGRLNESLRGAWVSSVYNLDWPSDKSYGNEAVQKLEYAQLLDELQAMGINAVFVQVRPSADALYPSRLVPWSKYLTGAQGADPGYDPLAYMIEETHGRGMKFHAWFNPFRATVDGNTADLAPNHVANIHPEWVVRAGSRMYINPGIAEARQHVVNAIMEAVRGYEIDGVHLDDYFYPSGTVFPDAAQYNEAVAAGSKLSLDDWRRDNINQFVRKLGASIRAVKPNVEFGISPFGVWRNAEDDPTGSATKASVTAYDDMHADARAWIRGGWIDYILPQIYWSLSLPVARYDVLVDWWTNEVSGTGVDLYIGHAPYKLGTTEAGWGTAAEIINQLKYNENKFDIKGSVFFSAKNLRANPLGIASALRQYYKAD